MRKDVSNVRSNTTIFRGYTLILKKILSWRRCFSYLATKDWKTPMSCFDASRSLGRADDQMYTEVGRY